MTTTQLAKRDAIIDLQTKFFRALRAIYNWPLEQLTFSPTPRLREAWEKHLDIARRCAYRTETIEPDHAGEMRYDIMIEIVKLETKRVEDFLSTFDHYRNIIYDQYVTDDDENYCNDTMLSYLDQQQVNVAISKTPHWIEEERRPPLTWYAFMSPLQPAYPKASPDRLLAQEYYD
jgi:hypothetical protein